MRLATGPRSNSPQAMSAWPPPTAVTSVVDVVGAQADEVGVEEHDDGGVGGGHARLQGLALARLRLVDDPGAVGRGHRRGAVGRAVVDHDDLVDQGGVERREHDRAHRGGLVAGGDDRRHPVGPLGGGPRRGGGRRRGPGAVGGGHVAGHERRGL